VEPGTIIGGKYQLVESVAEGGLATVWMGVVRDEDLPVAVKVMKRQFAAVGGNYLDTFVDEARIGAQLEHENLVHVIDLVQHETGQGPTACLVMEWIDGIDLRGLVEIETGVDRPLPWELVAVIGRGVLHGLSAAHQRKLAGGITSPVIHRDVAPQNILLGADGAIKLTDFGMARAKDRIAEHTAPGVIKGTLSYVAPEILKGQPPGVRSDVYSLGVTLWEALVGERMFHAASQIKLIEMIRNSQIAPLGEKRPDVPAPFVDAIHRALLPDREHRFQTADAMAAALDEILAGAGARDGGPQRVATAVSQALASRVSDGDS
jgi:serine/threonine-protein kinase